MARYRISLDLAATIGAQVLNLKARPRKDGETDEEYSKVPVFEFVCVPTQFNDMQVVADNSSEEYRNFSGKHVYMTIVDQPIHAQNTLVQSQRRRLLQDGKQETAYNVACRDIHPFYGKEHTEKLRARYEAYEKAKHPEWVSLADQGRSLPRGTERNPLTRAINAHIPYSIGHGYLIEETFGQAAQTAAPMAAPAQTPQYTEPWNDAVADPLASEYADPNSDLPF